MMIPLLARFELVLPYYSESMLSVKGLGGIHLEMAAVKACRPRRTSLYLFRVNTKCARGPAILTWNTFSAVDFGDKMV
jgi:hypothetical protein